MVKNLKRYKNSLIFLDFNTFSQDLNLFAHCFVYFNSHFLHFIIVRHFNFLSILLPIQLQYFIYWFFSSHHFHSCFCHIIRESCFVFRFQISKRIIRCYKVIFLLIIVLYFFWFQKILDPKMKVRSNFYEINSIF